jgi:hypothetical protein
MTFGLASTSNRSVIVSVTTDDQPATSSTPQAATDNKTMSIEQGDDDDCTKIISVFYSLSLDKMRGMFYKTTVSPSEGVLDPGWHISVKLIDTPTIYI